MALARTVLAVAREEAAIVTAEVASTSRTAAIGVAHAAEKEAISPVGVRQASKSAFQQSSTAGESILSHHLALSNSVAESVSHASTISATGLHEAQTLTSRQVIQSRSVVQETLQQDLGTTLRETLSNATQTGAEEQSDELVEVAKNLLENIPQQSAST